MSEATSTLMPPSSLWRIKALDVLFADAEGGHACELEISIEIDSMRSAMTDAVRGGLAPLALEAGLVSETARSLLVLAVEEGMPGAGDYFKALTGRRL